MAEHRDTLAQEQRIVDALYARLDELRDATAARLAAVRKQGPTGSPQNRSERDSFATHYEDRLALLHAVEERLVFGHLSLTDDSTRHIGRVGLTDAQHQSILTDWRAPAAEPFYRATLAHPQGVIRRRHLTTSGRQVTAVEDELLTLSDSDEELPALQGEGALLSAMARGRTGKMGDIVATIQREQDEIIRAPLHGAHVVQGGPGTGKTAVALHRAAYLLYAHRRVLERSGVLLIGPSSAFLRYIDQVLPSLGETGVVSTTLASLMPGVVAEAEDSPEAAALKGDVRFARYVRAAVKARQQVPSQNTTLRIDGHLLVVTPRDVKESMTRARRANKPHNEGWDIFARDMLNKLAAQYAQDMPYHVAAEDRADIIAELRSHREVRRLINLAWFPISAPQLIDTLLSRPHRLLQAAPDLTDAERSALLRPPGSAWTTSDIPLLDEAEELLGPLPGRNHQAPSPSVDHEYAQAVINETGVAGLVSAHDLEARFRAHGPVMSLAERAGSDRQWTYGHVIVDEAQELSPMDWRMLIRRCPTRSFTIVGDTAQTSRAGGARTWEGMFTPVFREHWTQHTLTINYRTPAAIADTAMRYAHHAGLTTSPLTSARDVAGALDVIRVPDDGWDNTLVTAVNEAISRFISADRGQVAVITSSRQLSRITSLVDTCVARHGDVRRGSVDTLTPRAVKGLEFDAVILVDPQEIEDEVGASDLFVALTRPTQHLSVLTPSRAPWFSAQ